MARVRKKARVLSKMVSRANARTSGMLARAMPESQPASAPQRLRAHQTTSAMDASVNSSAGRRAAASVGPNVTIAAAAAAK
jgi:hypothetical protein